MDGYWCPIGLVIILGLHVALTNCQFVGTQSVTYCQASGLSELLVNLECPGNYFLRIVKGHAGTPQSDITSCISNPVVVNAEITCSEESATTTFTRQVRDVCNLQRQCRQQISLAITLPLLNSYCTGNRPIYYYRIEYQCLDAALPYIACKESDWDLKRPIYNINEGYPQGSPPNASYSCTFGVIPLPNHRLVLLALDIAPLGACPMYFMNEKEDNKLLVCGNSTSSRFVGEYGKDVKVRYNLGGTIAGTPLATKFWIAVQSENQQTVFNTDQSSLTSTNVYPTSTVSWYGVLQSTTYVQSFVNSTETELYKTPWFIATVSAASTLIASGIISIIICCRCWCRKRCTKSKNPEPARRSANAEDDQSPSGSHKACQVNAGHTESDGPGQDHSGHKNKPIPDYQGLYLVPDMTARIDADNKYEALKIK